MDQKQNNSEIQGLEERLSALIPLGDSSLEDKILSQNPKNTFSGVVLSEPIASIPGNLHHVSCLSAMLPVLTGFSGAVLGAVAMFLIFTFATSPQVEIREVVRYVAVESEKPELALTLPLQETETVALPEQKILPLEQPRQNVWLGATFSFLNPPQRDVRTMLDLDAMIERQRLLAQNYNRNAPRQYRTYEQKTEISPTNFHSEEYQSLLDELCL